MTTNAFQPGEFYNYPLIIKKLLNTPLIYTPEKEIVYRDSFRYTYRDMNQRVHRLAGALANLGIAAGDTVAVMDYDSHRYLECFFAIPMMGAVLQTVNWRLSEEQIIYTLNHAEAKAVLVNADFVPIWETIRAKVPAVKTAVLIVEPDAAATSTDGFEGEYESLLGNAPETYDFVDLDEHTKATTFYTTGTTGNPKGVHFSHRQLVLHTLAVAVANGGYEIKGTFRSNDVYMPITPMFHVHAWGYPYIATLLGAKQVYPGRYEPEMLLKLAREEKVTFSHCVPTILQMLLSTAGAADHDFSTWKVVIGGAKLPRGLAKTALDMGIDIISGYGMSETCPVMAAAKPKEKMTDLDQDGFLDIITKTGLPIPLAEIEVVDANDKPLAHDGNSTGEVVMRSPWLTKSYFKEADKTRELWRNGWLHSGDVGFIDGEGYLQITDRIKDVIKTGGEWISSLDLENLMSQHEAVLESAAVGVADEKWGERPLMLVTLKPEYKEKVGADELKAHMSRAAAEGIIPKYGVPDKYVLVDEIPKTSVGKLNKKEIRNQFS